MHISRAFLSFSRFIAMSTGEQWSHQASVYAENVPQLTSLHALDLIRLIQSDIEKAATILDVGCGSGAFAQAYLQIFPKGIPDQTLILSDFSEGMLNKAQEAVKVPADYQTQVKFQIEDGTALKGIDSGSIDVVVSIFGVFLIPDQEACQSAIRRVLKPGSGVFANASWIFGRSSMLKLQGLGVSLQDVFQIPLMSVDPDFKMMGSIDAWGHDDGIREIMGVGYSFSDISIHHAVHTNVWDFSVLWNMLKVNPMSNLKDAPEEKAETAKQAVLKFVDQDISKPVVLWAASNLCVGRNLKSI